MDEHVRAIVEDIHAKLDMLLVPHVLLSDLQLMGIARRIHFALVARGLDIRQFMAAQAAVTEMHPSDLAQLQTEMQEE